MTIEEDIEAYRILNLSDDAAMAEFTEDAAKELYGLYCAKVDEDVEAFLREVEWKYLPEDMKEGWRAAARPLVNERIAVTALRAEIAILEGNLKRMYVRFKQFEGLAIHHKDGNPRNSDLSNLEMMPLKG